MHASDCKEKSLDVLKRKKKKFINIIRDKFTMSIR